MSTIMNGVYRLSDGLLLRYGICDFTKDGSFDSGIEAQELIPEGIPLCTLNPYPPPPSEFITHWNGSAWDFLPRSTE